MSAPEPEGDAMSEIEVSLREITAETLGPILSLEVAPAQRNFVAPNAVSIAEAHFHEHAWFRGIYAGDTAVGFVMFSLEPGQEGAYLWRYMIGADHQGRGYGRRALDLAIDEVRAAIGASYVLTSYVPGDGSAGGFYRALGFEETGQLEGVERVMRLQLPRT
jgi:diamine N-acetyltransferase